MPEKSIGISHFLMMLAIALPLFAMLPLSVHGQQARGLFFAVYGKDAPSVRGDHNHMQAIYFELPESEERPVYLRIFDAETGGFLDDRQGRFNTKTRYLLLGGESAAKTFGGRQTKGYTPLDRNEILSEDIIHDVTMGSDARFDGRYFPLGRLEMDRGHLTEDGYRRFAFLAVGVEGDDGNFFDFVLSYDQNDKVEPEHYRMFAYDITLRMPPDNDFIGQIRIPVVGRDTILVSTFSMSVKPPSIQIPFQPEIPLRTSLPGEWMTEVIALPTSGYVESVGFDFRSSPADNVFSFLVKGSDGKPIPIPLPILDYEPTERAKISLEQSYAPDNCKTVNLEKILINGDNFLSAEAIWKFSDDTLRGNPVSRTFDQPGYHPFTLHVDGQYRGDPQTIALFDSVFINQPPTAWAGGNRSFIAGEPMVFDGTVSEDPDGRIIRYAWDFGDGNTGEGARFDHTFRQAGTYTVTLTVTDDSNSPCNTAQATATVRVNLPPVARIDAPAAAQLGEVVRLDATGSHDPDGEITAWLWEINGDAVSSDSILYYTIERSAPVSVRLHVTDDAFTRNSTATASHTIRVNRSPIANAGADKHVSPNRPATFNANRSRDPDGQIVLYEWFFPDDIVLEGMVVRQGIATPGDHYVYLRVTDNEGATDMDSLYVRVNYPPVPIISGELMTTDGQVSLSAAESYDPDGEIISYEWHMGDGRRIVGQNANHTYRCPGKYNVRLTIVDNSGTYSSVQSTQATVHVNQLPVARITAPASGAAGEAVAFDGTRSSDPDGEIIRYLWDFGDGTTEEGAQVEHIFEQPGRYQVQLTVFDDTDHPDATGYAYSEVLVKGPPVIVANHPTRAAPGTLVEIDLRESQSFGSEIARYFWYTEAGWEQGDGIREFMMSEEGDLEIRFAVENDADLPNSRKGGSVVIRPNQPPQIAGLSDILTHEKTIFLDASASSDPDGDNLRFSWDFGDGNTGEGPAVSHTYAESGTYTVTLHADDQQGLTNSVAKAEIQVLISREPQVTVNLPEIACVGESFRFEATTGLSIDGNPLLVNWDMGDGTRFESASGTHRYTTPGRYTINVRSDDQLGLPNSVTTRSYSLTVASPPVADAGPDQTACVMAEVHFDGSASASGTAAIKNAVWDFGDGNSGSGLTTTHIYERPGTYQAVLRVSCAYSEACGFESADTVKVTILPAAFAAFELPAFIPEGSELDLDASPSLRANSGEPIEIIWTSEAFGTVRWERERASGEWLRFVNGERSPSQRVTASVGTRSLPITTVAPTPGNFDVRLEVRTGTASACNTATAVQQLEVRSLPDVQIAGASVITPGQRQRFTLSGSDRHIRAIQDPVWIAGDQRAEGAEATFGWARPGTYTVAVYDRALSPDGEFNADLMAALDEYVVRVNAPPVPAITGPDIVDRGETVRFSALDSSDPDGEIAQYAWTLSDGTTFNEAEIDVAFDQPGWLTLTLVVTDNDGLSNSRQSISREIQVTDPHMVQSMLPPAFCIGDTADLPSALSLPEDRFNELEVQLNGVSLSFEEARSIHFDEGGRQRLTVIGNRGESLLNEEFDVFGPPQILARVPSEARLGRADNTVMFDATQTVTQNGPGIRTYWDFGDGTTAAGRIVRHIYRQPGTYTVTLTAVANHDYSCNVSVETYTITILPD